MECAVAVALWAAIVFVVPAGFLQVTLHGRHRAAFAIWRTLPFVRRNLRAYAAAWWHSGLASLGGHFALPIAPWGVVWCYLAIVALFNGVLVVAGIAPGEGWLQRAIGDPRFAPRGRIGRFTLRDGAGATVTAIDLALFAAPLPRWPLRMRRRAPTAGR